MNHELKKYYEDRLLMMGSTAWAELMIDLEMMIKSVDTIRGLDEKKLHFRQGELSIMDWLHSLKESSAKAYEELNADSE